MNTTLAGDISSLRITSLIILTNVHSSFGLSAGTRPQYNYQEDDVDMAEGESYTIWHLQVGNHVTT